MHILLRRSPDELVVALITYQLYFNLSWGVTGHQYRTRKGSFCTTRLDLFEIEGIDMLDFGNLGKQGVR